MFTIGSVIFAIDGTYWDKIIVRLNAKIIDTCVWHSRSGKAAAATLTSRILKMLHLMHQLYSHVELRETRPQPMFNTQHSKNDARGSAEAQLWPVRTDNLF